MEQIPGELLMLLSQEDLRVEVTGPKDCKYAVYLMRYDGGKPQQIVISSEHEYDSEEEARSRGCDVLELILEAAEERGQHVLRALGREPDMSPWSMTVTPATDPGMSDMAALELMRLSSTVRVMHDVIALLYSWMQEHMPRASIRRALRSAAGRYNDAMLGEDGSKLSRQLFDDAWGGVWSAINEVEDDIDSCE